ncbi:hypothetical protein IIU_00833 [Bacillus cereus VD133]|uniref:Uncharacterized protein n=1 Tax=Bacillus cereus VD133 TaxID=1053233 RepID=A0A9W5V4M8_BACCE|nr:hypothetical protein IIU_00833 [Bacillus cereus VD133]
MEESSLSLMITGLLICGFPLVVYVLDKPIKRWTKDVEVT